MYSTTCSNFRCNWRIVTISNARIRIEIFVSRSIDIFYLLDCKRKHFIPNEIFDMFPVLKQMQNRRGGDLSGGQQQQLAIAWALITQPRLLLLDEPTEGIQPNIIQQIGEVIRHLRTTSGMAIILVEQYFDFAYDLADRFIVLRRGEVLINGARKDVTRDELLQAVTV